jgi:prepilin-type N-terminal cleavage/methylation domain-containing protein
MMKMFKSVRNHKGFTLVEMAIVLVIIGIILGGVLKGQELINNAKMKRLYNQYREIMAATYTYYDRYGKLPGDDSTANTRGGIWATAVNGDGNGIINANAAMTTNYVCVAVPGAPPAGEMCGIWQHLRMANIISGTTTSAVNPTNAYGGAISAANATIGLAGSTVNGTWVAFQNIPNDVALAIDTQYDDGVWNTGTIQASALYTTTALISLYIKM